MSEWEYVPDLPTLVVPAPYCSHCGREVQTEGDSAWCGECRVEWSRIEDGWASRPDPEEDGSDVPCEIAPRAERGHGAMFVHGPCILPSGHEGDHLCPMRREPVTDREVGSPDA